MVFQFERGTKKFLVIILLILLSLPLTSAYSLTYDTDKNNVSMSYDSKNRILTKDNITYSYDSGMNDTLTNVTNDNVIIKYEYDSRKRITKETKIIDGISFEREVNYDSMDRVTSEEGSMNTINFTYGNNALIKIIDNFLNISYNEQNNPVQRFYKNILTTNFTYDPDNFRLTRIKTGSKQNLDYEYDNVGNVELINDSANLRTESMDYDNLDRLVYVRRTDNGTVTYTDYFSYDSIGNMLQALHNTEKMKLYYGSTPKHAPYMINLITNATFSNDKLIVRDKENNNVARLENEGDLILKGECSSSLDCVMPSTTDLFIIRDDSDTDLAYFDIEGNVFLKGSCSSGGSCSSPPTNSYVFQNSTGGNVSYIDSSGNLCITQGNCSDHSATCNPSSNAFLIQDSSKNNVSYIDFTGDLCLKGTLTENSYFSQDDYFMIKNSSNKVVSYINPEGNLCIEKGDCSDLAASCNPASDAFIMQDPIYRNTSYIDFTGDLCLTGVLVENGNP